MISINSNSLKNHIQITLLTLLYHFYQKSTPIHHIIITKEPLNSRKRCAISMWVEWPKYLHQCTKGHLTEEILQETWYIQICDILRDNHITLACKPLANCYIHHKWSAGIHSVYGPKQNKIFLLITWSKKEKKISVVKNSTWGMEERIYSWYIAHLKKPM